VRSKLSEQDLVRSRGVLGPRSLPCSLVGFWRPKMADLLYKFPAQPPDLLYFELTFGATIPIFRCGGPKFSLLGSFSNIYTLYLHFPTTLESFSSILGLQNQSHLDLMSMLCQKKSRAPRDLLYSSRTLVFSSLFYSIKWPEIGPFWGVDLLYRRPPGKVVTGGLVGITDTHPKSIVAPSPSRP
jgi:hypothetical protein